MLQGEKGEAALEPPATAPPTLPMKRGYSLTAPVFLQFREALENVQGRYGARTFLSAADIGNSSALRILRQYVMNALLPTGMSDATRIRPFRMRQLRTTRMPRNVLT